MNSNIKSFFEDKILMIDWTRYDMRLLQNWDQYKRESLESSSLTSSLSIL